ncbi:MAG: hypothetical protein KBG62_00190 [Propionivibrio sp.]|jgi:hypothetical protein|nr:hypothetical protein [Propionivibrio sp.]
MALPELPQGFAIHPPDRSERRYFAFLYALVVRISGKRQHRSQRREQPLSFVSKSNPVFHYGMSEACPDD